MSFVALQENLRKEVRKRIEAGELTGMALARRIGFTQAHISNFLNGKRGLKLSALDRMLKALELSVYDLLNPHDLGRYAAAPSGSSEDYVDVPLVEGSVAASSEVIVNEQVKELIRLRRSFINRLSPDLAVPARKSWTRFVLIRLTAKEAAALAPRFTPGSLLLVDRHSTAVRAAHREGRNLYAVRRGGTCLVRYVEHTGAYLVLRGESPDSPAEVLPLAAGENPANSIIGRIAGAEIEL
jgi:transcriptional regulator with XRE-family HTH domain